MKKNIKRLTRKFKNKLIYFFVTLILGVLIYVLNLYGLINFDIINNEEKYNDIKNTNGHQHNEASYQEIWCKAHNGIKEYKNRDYTRVDCLTKDNAVEFDFATKWAESIGQALHYQLMTGKRAKVVLILEKPTDKSTYYKRVETLAKKYNFDVEAMTPNDLRINKNGECPIKKCKCHKKLKLTQNKNLSLF